MFQLPRLTGRHVAVVRHHPHDWLDESLVRSSVDGDDQWVVMTRHGWLDR